MLGRVLPIIGRSIAGWWDNVMILAVANVIWALSALPAVGVLLLGGNFLVLLAVVVVAVLLAGPTTAALFYLTTSITRMERLELRTFFSGIRLYYRRGWLAGGLNGAFAILAFVNILFYNSPNFAGSPLAAVNILWFYLIAVWFVMQIYLWPLAVRMETVSLTGLLRNAALAAFKYPFFSLALAFFLFLLLLGSFLVSFVPTVLFGAAFHTVVCNKALTTVLEQEQARKAKQQPNPSLEIEVPLPIKPETDHAERPAERPAGVAEDQVEAVDTRNVPLGVIRRSPSLPQQTAPRPED